MGEEDGEGVEGRKEADDSKKASVHTYALVIESDMSEELKGEAIEQVVTACEKHAANNEAAAKMIKTVMDQKFGPRWHVVVGEGYGFQISYEAKYLLYMFFGGNIAICMWRCS